MDSTIDGDREIVVPDPAGEYEYPVEQILSPLEVGDFARAYFIREGACEVPIANDFTSFSWIGPFNGPCRGDIGWELYLYTTDGTPINGCRVQGDRPRPFVSELHLRLRLKGGSGEGRVGRLVWIYLAPKFRRKRVGKVYLAAGETIFARWGAQEVHLQAADQGLAQKVWFRAGFLPDDETRGLLELQWESYQRLRGVPSNRLNPLPASWEDWDEGFLAWMANEKEVSVPLFKRLQ